MITSRFNRHPGEGRGPAQREKVLSWVWVPAFAGMTMLLSGCSDTNLSEKKLACESSPNLKGGDSDLAAQDARQVAVFGIDLSRKVRAQAQSAWFGTGMMSDTLGRFSGTEAISLAINVRLLRTMLANQRAIDLSLSMDGKNPLPSKAGWACELLADSVASLDTGQSDEQFLENIEEVEAYFKRAYELNGGQNIEAELAELGTTGGQQ